MAGLVGSLGLIGILLLIVVAILWVLMPFAIFGIKDLARAVITQQKTTNKLLEQLLAQRGENIEPPK